MTALTEHFLFKQQPTIAPLMLVALVATSSLALTSNAWSQSVAPRDVSREVPFTVNAEQEGLRRQEELTRQQQERLEPKLDVLQRPAPATLSRDLPIESPCFYIKDIAFTGPDAPRFRFLQATAAPFLEHCAGAHGVSLMAAVLDAKLIELGYVTTRVSLPQQNLSSGQLVFTLHVGRVAAMDMVQAGTPGQLPDTSWGTWYNAFPVQPGAVLNIHDLEQGVEQMKRLPSQSVATKIVPGQEPDTSVVLIERQAGTWRERIRGGVTLDNSGAPAMGRSQMSSYLSLDNLSGLNDILSLSGNANLEQPNSRHRSQGWSLSDSLPWGYSTLTATRSASHYAQIVQGTTARFLSSGNSDSSELKWHYLLLRGASSKLGVYASVATRRANSFLDDVELVVQRRRTTNLDTGLTFMQLLPQGSIEVEFGYRQGMPWQAAQDDLPGADPGGLTLRPRITTLTSTLKQPFQLAQRALQYTGALRLQRTPDHTVSSDQFSIGNRFSVRGFDGDNILLAESGLTLRNELSTALAILDGVDASLFVGLDAGRVWGPSAVNLAGSKLAGLAVGLRAKWKVLQFDGTLATPLYAPPGFQSRRWNPYVSLISAF